MIKPKVSLVGKDGNAFSILAACIKAAKKAGWSQEQIAEFTDHSKSADYSYLLFVVKENFTVE